MYSQRAEISLFLGETAAECCTSVATLIVALKHYIDNRSADSAFKHFANLNCYFMLFKSNIGRVYIVSFVQIETSNQVWLNVVQICSITNDVIQSMCQYLPHTFIWVDGILYEHIGYTRSLDCKLSECGCSDMFYILTKLYYLS